MNVVPDLMKWTSTNLNNGTGATVIKRNLDRENKRKVTVFGSAEKKFETLTLTRKWGRIELNHEP
jgi:hypothetical protein